METNHFACLAKEAGFFFWRDSSVAHSNSPIKVEQAEKT